MGWRKYRARLRLWFNRARHWLCGLRDYLRAAELQRALRRNASAARALDAAVKEMLGR